MKKTKLPGVAVTAFATAILTLSVQAVTVDICNTDFIRGPDSGAATPYPSTLNVSGFVGSITDVDVTINNYISSEISGTRLLLVGPGGQNVMLMRWVSLGSGGPVTYRFDDEAADVLDIIDFEPSGSYRPTDFGVIPGPVAPAPAGPYGSALSVFDGTDPNGDWSLYLANFDFGGQVPAASRIENGWCLHISGVTTSVPDAGATALLLGLSLGGLGAASRLRRK